MSSGNIIKNPLSTEKAIHLLEEGGWLVFVVERKAKKPEIKKAIEEMYNVKVARLNTLITNKGAKRAYVKLSDKDSAMDLATRLGMM
ncbi:50S ribosomal protein L23 [Candidatus Woesearchaeota archaeon]|nr:50S ribosomal protein L23 [Candidatus Woesearchaeota archaeon]